MMAPDKIMRALWYLFTTGAVYTFSTWGEGAGNTTTTISADEVQAELGEFAREHGLPGNEPQALLEMFIEETFPGEDASRLQFQPDGSIIHEAGFPDVEFLSGFEVIEDLTATNWKDVTYVVIVKQVPVWKVRERWPKRSEHVTGAPPDYLDGWYRTERQLMLESENRGIANAYETTEVREMYLTRGRRKKYPKGWKAVAVEGQIMESGPSPFDNVAQPVNPIYEQPDPNQIRPSCICDDLISIQGQINNIDAKILEYIGKTVHPDVLAEEGSVDLSSFFTKSPGTQFYKRDSQKPQPWPLETIPPFVLQEKDMLVSQLKDIAGLMDPSQGQPSRLAPSGRAILALNERADRQFAQTSKMIEKGLTDCSRHIVQLWAQFGSQNYTARIVGQDGTAAIVTLRGETLIAQRQNQGQADLNFDLQVELGTPRNRSTALDEIDWMLERGLLDPVQDASRILYASRTGDLSRLDDGIKDRTNAAKENEQFRMMADMMARGEVSEDGAATFQALEQLVLHRPMDDPLIHLQEHRRLVLSEDWHEFDNVLQAIIMRHIDAHKQVQTEAEAAAQEQLAAQQNGKKKLPSSTREKSTQPV
ncbi:MAG: portal protein [Planctomycetota bacterium]